MKGGFAEEHVEERRVQSLDHKEEELLSGDIPRCHSDHNTRRIRPYPVLDKIRIPRTFLRLVKLQERCALHIHG
jgi:hypothetical protein